MSSKMAAFSLGYAGIGLSVHGSISAKNGTYAGKVVQVCQT
jgi:hypothetical protein